MQEGRVVYKMNRKVILLGLVRRISRLVGSPGMNKSNDTMYKIRLSEYMSIYVYVSICGIVEYE